MSSGEYYRLLRIFKKFKLNFRYQHEEDAEVCKKFLKSLIDKLETLAPTQDTQTLKAQAEDVFERMQANEFDDFKAYISRL